MGGMSELSPDQVAAREAARVGGRFGAQHRSAPDAGLAVRPPRERLFEVEDTLQGADAEVGSVVLRLDGSEWVADEYRGLDGESVEPGEWVRRQLIEDLRAVTADDLVRAHADVEDQRYTLPVPRHRDMHDLQGWDEASCNDAEDLVVISSPYSSLTDMDGTYGEPVVYTEWADDDGYALVRNYRRPNEAGDWKCTHFVPRTPELRR